MFFSVKILVKFRNLQISKILNSDTNTIFPIPFEVMLPLRYSLKNNFTVYCQVFWVEVWCLQNQCISISALVFYYCISNNLPHDKNVIQM